VCFSVTDFEQARETREAALRAQTAEVKRLVAKLEVTQRAAERTLDALVSFLRCPRGDLSLRFASGSLQVWKALRKAWALSFLASP